MPWCPKCKSEYVEGTETCVDCGSRLVETLEEPPENNDLEQCILEFLEEGEMLVNSDLPENSDDESAEENSDFPEKSEDSEQEVRRIPVMAPPVYESARSRAEEHRSGAYPLLTMGTLGLLADIALFAGFIPISMNPASKLITCGVMGALFIIFIVMGISSLRSYKEYAGKAVEEENLEEQIRLWCSENLQAEAIDSTLPAEETAEEMKFFYRTEQMRLLLLQQFPEISESYLDHMIEELYPEIFGE